DLAARIDQPGGIEVAVGPLRVGLELVAADVDAELRGLCLKWRGDLTWHRVAGLVDPLINVLAPGRSLERELRQQHKPRRCVRRGTPTARPAPAPPAWSRRRARPGARPGSRRCLPRVGADAGPDQSVDLHCPVRAVGELHRYRDDVVTGAVHPRRLATRLDVA